MQEKLSEVVLILVSSTLIILLLAVLVVVALFINQRRRFKYRQDISEMKNAYEREVLKTQLETQAQTFEVISHELHDNVGTLISLALVHLKSDARFLGEGNIIEGSRNLSEVNTILDEALDILRDISRSINPERIEKLGLGESIRNELDRLKRTKMFTTELIITGEEFSIEPQRKMIFFRIIQEALNNIMKHAQAKHIIVKANFERPKFDLTIEDNGNGFAHIPDKVRLDNHSGIANMTKRAKLINALFSIKSEIGRGTVVSLSHTDL